MNWLEFSHFPPHHQELVIMLLSSIRLFSTQQSTLHFEEVTNWVLGREEVIAVATTKLKFLSQVIALQAHLGMEIFNASSPSCKKTIMHLNHNYARILNCFQIIIHLHTKGNDSIDEYRKIGGNCKLWCGQFNTPSFHPLIQNSRGHTKASCSSTSSDPSWALGPKLMSQWQKV